MAALFCVVEALYHYLQPAMDALRRDGLMPLPAAAPAIPPSEPRLPAERFIADWTSGKLPLPLRPCTAQQLYRAFQLRWIEGGGGRSPPTRHAFTRAAVDWVKRIDAAVQYKIVRLVQPDGSRLSVRCWVPVERESMAAGMSEGHWVAREADAFEQGFRAWSAALRGGAR